MEEITSFLELPSVFISLLHEVLENQGGGLIVQNSGRCISRRSLN